MVRLWFRQAIRLRNRNLRHKTHQSQRGQPQPQQQPPQRQNQLRKWLHKNEVVASINVQILLMEDVNRRRSNVCVSKVRQQYVNLGGLFARINLHLAILIP